jgi:2-polyprenyl-3-methyl-5-hydroxy-6-metoxy-1,4-benzoquinol methylase
MSDSLVTQFYTENVRGEWRRLVKNPYHRLEFDTTLHFLGKYLPPNGHVLDAGGGPGRYTLALARKGYDVTLLDATPANLDFARRMIKRYKIQDRVQQITPGSIVDLSQFPESSFDAILCTGGPLSHVMHAEGRDLAISEFVRVAKPGGPIFISVIGRMAVLVVILNESTQEIGMEHYQRLVDTGDYLGERGFTACHFFLPEEFRKALTRPDLEILEMVGLEGLSTQHINALNLLAKDEARFKFWFKTHLQTCTHPSVIGMSEHMLIVCRKIMAN